MGMSINREIEKLVPSFSRPKEGGIMSVQDCLKWGGGKEHKGAKRNSASGERKTFL